MGIEDDFEVVLRLAALVGRDRITEAALILGEYQQRQWHAQLLREAKKGPGGSHDDLQLVKEFHDAEIEYKKALDLFLKRHAPVYDDEFKRSAGRPPNLAYDLAYERILKGDSQSQAWVWYCRYEGLDTDDKDAEAAFKRAMRDRKKKAKRIK